MNALETKIVSFCASHRRTDSDMSHFDAVLLGNIEAEFYFATRIAKDWGQISDLPDTVMDICIRVSGIDWVASRGPRVKNPPNGSDSFQSLVRDACVASNRYSSAGIEERKAIKKELQSVYLRLGDLVSQAWSKRKR